MWKQPVIGNEIKGSQEEEDRERKQHANNDEAQKQKKVTSQEIKRWKTVKRKNICMRFVKVLATTMNCGFVVAYVVIEYIQNVQVLISSTAIFLTNVDK